MKIPCSVKEALAFNKENGNSKWDKAVKLETKSLNDLACFGFKPKGYLSGGKYKKTTLMIIMNVKQDLRHKCQLVTGGNIVNDLHHDIYSTTVKSISKKILQVIAHKANLNILCGDIGNAYTNGYTKKKVYAIAEDEFGKEMRGKIVIIKRALYGLRKSSER